jgi:uncharacterized membrane protein YhaH (DUF805 family)
MDWGNYLFGFQGRLNRSKYWLFVILSLAVLAAVVGLILAVEAGTPGLVAVVVVYLLMLYAGVAVGIKRLHDRDKSGWWLLIFFLLPNVLSIGGRLSGSVGLNAVLGLAALAILIWAVVELGCLRGTGGPNQYGPDPLGDTAIAPAARMR